MRRSGLTIQYGNLGNGEVNTVTVRDQLAPMDRAYLDAPLTARAENLRLLNNVAVPRSGYVAFAVLIGGVSTVVPTVAASAVTGLFQVQFDNNTVEYLRSDTAKTYYLNPATPIWTDIGANGVGTKWVYTMVRQAGGTTHHNQVMLCAGGDSDLIYFYRGNGVAATALPNAGATGAPAIKGARMLIGHRGRSLAANVIDVADSAVRRNTRVYYSQEGDPTVIATSGIPGSGFTDLDDDPYPIVGGRVIGGNICIFKGNNNAGSIVVGTLTGNYLTPYRWDTINTAEVGLLVPRSLVTLTPELCFFLGHDGFYLYDGARGLSRVADGINRDILARLNPGALDAGFTWINSALGEIHIALAMGASATPTETWVFNYKERRVYGPYAYTDTITAAANYVSTSTLTWDTIPDFTWDTIASSTWDTWGTIATQRTVLFGSSDGTIWNNDGTATADNATSVVGTYYFAPIRAVGRTLIMPDGSQRPLEEDAYLTLHDITLVYRNQGVFTPTVAVSTNGGTSYTTVSSGATVGVASADLDRTRNAFYSTELSGTWFLLKVSGAAPMQLLGARMEFSYGGNARSD